MNTSPNNQPDQTLDQALDQLLSSTSYRASDGFSARVMSNIQKETQEKETQTNQIPFSHNIPPTRTSFPHRWKLLIPTLASAAALTFFFNHSPQQTTNHSQPNLTQTAQTAQTTPQNNIDDDDVEAFLRSSDENKALFLTYLTNYTETNQPVATELLQEM